MRPESGGYDGLVSFYKDWRAFQKPKLPAGVPDYTSSAMAAQQKMLAQTAAMAQAQAAGEAVVNIKRDGASQ